MSNNNYTELSDSDDCEKYINQFIQEFPLRSAEIGQGTVIKRALPSRHKRMIGAWCFLDHAGPAVFPQGDGLDVGPHPHIGLQTFTWMIEGSMMHTDSLGSRQLIRPGQVNLMTAGYGIAHAEVAPETETHLHAAQLWIALPDSHRHIAPRFQHYPDLPKTKIGDFDATVLAGEALLLLAEPPLYGLWTGLLTAAIILFNFAGVWAMARMLLPKLLGRRGRALVSAVDNWIKK